LLITETVYYTISTSPHGIIGGITDCINRGRKLCTNLLEVKNVPCVSNYSIFLALSAIDMIMSSVCLSVRPYVNAVHCS